MHLTADVHDEYARDRQQLRLAEAAAYRVADRMLTRSRIARFLQQAADRPDAATAAPGQLGKALPQRS